MRLLTDNAQSTENVWECYHCGSSHIKIYGDTMFCNSCLRTSRVSGIFHGLEEK